MAPSRRRLSPIQRVPTEILQDIFFFCIPTIVDAHECPMIEYSQPPLLLTRICAEWRDIAQSMGSLWSSLYLDIPNPYDPDMVDWSWHYEGFKRWMSYTGSQPLRLLIAEDHSDCDPYTYPILRNGSPFYTYVDTLKKYSSQWQDITLMLYPARTNAFRSLSSKDVPNLKTFIYIQARPTAVGLYGFPEHTIISQAPFRFLHGAPSLSCLRFTGIGNARVCPDMASLPLSQLYELELSRYLDGTWSLRREFGRDILRQCTSLERLKIDFPDPLASDSLLPPPPGPTPPPYTLPYLKGLYVHLDSSSANDNYSIVELLAPLRLPKLTSLEVGASLHSFEAVNSVLNLVKMSNAASIVQLSLSLIKHTDSAQLANAIISCLQLMPRLEEFILVFAWDIASSSDVTRQAIEGCTEDILTALTYDETESPSRQLICPALTQVRFFDICSERTSTIPPSLSSFINSRIKPSPESGIHPLTLVRVQRSASVDIDHIDEDNRVRRTLEAKPYAKVVQKWRKEGLDVWINIGKDHSKSKAKMYRNVRGTH